MACCEACGRPAEWARTEGGRRILIDPPGALRKVMVEVAWHTDGTMIVGYVDQLRPHLVSCPNSPKRVRNRPARTIQIPL